MGCTSSQWPRVKKKSRWGTLEVRRVKRFNVELAFDVATIYFAKLVVEDEFVPIIVGVGVGVSVRACGSRSGAMVGVD